MSQPSQDENEEEEAPPGSAHKPNWSEWYPKCKRWSEIWFATEDHKIDWPQGIQKIEGRLFLDSKLCIPSAIQNEWIRISHQNLGHVGGERLWTMIENKFEWADKVQVENFVKLVTRQCDSCQACQRPRNKYGPIV